MSEDGGWSRAYWLLELFENGARAHRMGFHCVPPPLEPDERAAWKRGWIQAEHKERMRIEREAAGSQQ